MKSLLRRLARRRSGDCARTETAMGSHGSLRPPRRESASASVSVIQAAFRRRSPRCRTTESRDARHEPGAMQVLRLLRRLSVSGMFVNVLQSWIKSESMFADASLREAARAEAECRREGIPKFLRCAIPRSAFCIPLIDVFFKTFRHPHCLQYWIHWGHRSNMGTGPKSPRTLRLPRRSCKGRAQMEPNRTG